MKYAVAAIALVASTPAFAQPQPIPPDTSDHISCFHKTASREARALAGHVYLDPQEVKRRDAEPGLAGARKACAEKFGWNEEQKSMAYEATLYMTYADLLYDRLDVEEERIVSRVGEQLLYVDKKPLIAADWRKDTALDDYVRAELAERGMTEPETQRLASELIWALHNHIALYDRWEARWPSPKYDIRPAAPTPRARTPAPPG
jgi:hypothetical protein